MNERYFSVADVAEILGYSKHQIRHFLRSGMIRGFRIGKNSDWRVLEVEIERLITEGLDKQEETTKISS